MHNLELHYGRSGELYDGRFFLSYSGEHSGGQSSFELVGVTFLVMMTRLSKLLCDYPDIEQVTLHRTERQNSSYSLDKGTIDLLRRDAAAAVESMTHAPRTVVVRDKITVEDQVTVKLRAGVDTLAGAFGDRVYLAFNTEDKMECPFCGRWTGLGAKYDDLAGMTLECEKCSIVYKGFCARTASWCELDTVALLASGANKFFIPREWNVGGPWITHEALQQRYDAFNKEREHV